MNHGGPRKGAGRPKGQGYYGEATKPVRIPISLVGSILKYVDHKGYSLPLYRSKISAGCVAPAEDDIEEKIDLNGLMIRRPRSTFLVRVTGQSMKDCFINDNDILVVDRSITPVHGRIVVAAIDGMLTVKRLRIEKKKWLLMPENPEFSPIEITEANQINIWGVVLYAIHKL